MRAVLCHDWGGPDDLSLEEVEAPAPGPGEIRIAVAAAGINFADSLMIAGKYQERPAFPFTPGLEIAGTVEALGAGVTRFREGQRVMATPDRGGFAEATVARESDVFPLPDAMDFVTAAGFPITYGTAHGSLVWRAGLQAGESLLVHGAAGGVGLATVEVGKALGARVIATASTAEKLAIAEAHGADHLIESGEEALRDKIKELTEGRGVDVVFDPVGGDLFDISLRATAWNGRLLVVGFAAGRVPQVPANYLLVKNLSAVGFYWGSYRKHDPARLAPQFEQLFGWFEAGKLQPLVSEQFDLADAGTALRRLIERRSTGKLVLTTGLG